MGLVIFNFPTHDELAQENQRIFCAQVQFVTLKPHKVVCKGSKTCMGGWIIVVIHKHTMANVILPLYNLQEYLSEEKEGEREK